MTKSSSFVGLIVLVVAASLLALGQLASTASPASAAGSLVHTRIAAGDEHTCALAQDGTISCWGTDEFGQLGDGTTTLLARFEAEPVIGISRAIAVTSGADHSCALISNHSVECWGRNQHHQLGDGTNAPFSATPVAVRNLSNVVALAAGADHTCALLDDATVKCWGDDAGGGLLVPAGAPSGPLAVDGLTDVTEVSAGATHDCAVLSDGTLECWGQDTFGQLGDGATHSSATPVVASKIDNVAEVVAGTNWTCALKHDGTAWCWGHSSDHVLGDKILEQSSEPRQISRVSGNSSIPISGGVAIAGWSAVCVLEPDETMWCWGEGHYGQMGEGQHHNDYLAVQPQGVDNALDFTVGGEHVCAWLADETVKCWGKEADGATGAHAPGNILTPQSAAGFSAGDVALGNDDRSAAHWIVGLPFADSVDMTLASASGAEPQPTCAATQTQRSAWYRYQTPYGRSLNLSTATPGASVAVYTDDGSSLTEIACATNGADQGFDASPGTPYFIQLGSDSTVDTASLSVAPAGDAPNDDFADATAVAAVPYSDEVDTTTAGLQSNEPTPSCAPNNPPLNSVWYRYDAVADGAIQVAASGYPLRVGVYTGTGLSDLQQVACIDGSGDDSTLNVSSGTSYFIQVVGLDGSGKLAFGVDVAAPVDTTKPVIDSAPLVTQLQGAALSADQIRIDWSGHDAGSGINRYELQRRVGSGSWKTVATGSAATTTLTEKIGVSETFRVRATDNAGNVSDWVVGPTYTPTLKQENWKKLHYSTGWKKQSASADSGGALRWTNVKGATVSFTFTGRAIQIVSGLAPGHGAMRVTVDGATTTVDLSAASVRYQRIVLAASWSSSGPHTVKITATSTAPVDLDALVIVK